VGKVFDKIGLTIPWLPPIWRYGNHIEWKIPKRHPVSASFNILKALKKRGSVRFYDLWEKTTARMQEGDTFIGLPLQVYDGRSWDDPSINCVTRRTLETYNLKGTIILPYCHDLRYNQSTTGLIEKYGKNLIILSGKYWTDTWDQSPIKGHVTNLLRVNMGIDPTEYPVIKKKFNPPGKRKFLYIGQAAWYKNTTQLEEIAKAIPGFEGGYISSGEIAGWKKIASWADLTTEFMEKIAEEYDIFVNTSSADPSPATILENMCFGFAVACTPESSYDYPSLTRLHVSDTAFNVKQLQELQYMDEAELLRRAQTNRDIAIRNHDWQDITDKIVGFLERVKTEKGIFLVE
jgi:hypothetical protein